MRPHLQLRGGWWRVYSHRAETRLPLSAFLTRELAFDDARHVARDRGLPVR